MKKFTHIFAFIFTVIFLAACGGGKSNNKDITLTWISDNNPARVKQIQIFERLNPGIKVRLNSSIQGKDDIILTQLASGSPAFDLLDVYVPEFLTTLIEKGAILDITERLASDSIDTSEFWPGCMAYVSRKGRIFGMPANAGNVVLWYNKKLFQQAGIEPIKKKLTWDELFSIARKLTVRDPKSGRISRFGFTCAEWVMYPMLINQSGGEYIDVQKRTIGFDNPSFRKYFSMFRDARWKKDVQCMPNSANLESMEKAGNWGGGSTFAAEMVAMDINGRWMLAEWRKHKSLEYDIAPLPYIPGQKPYNMFLSHSTVIPKNSPKADAAYKFLKFMASDAYHETILKWGDGVPSVMSYVNRDEFLHPKALDEQNNQIYIDEMKYAIARKVYPEVDLQKFDSVVLNAQFSSFVVDNATTLDEAMTTIKTEVKNYFIP